MEQESPEEEVMIKPKKEELNDSSTNADKSAKEVDVDEYLEYVGQFGKFQILLVLLFCLIIIPPTYQTLIMSFVGSSPAWRCVQQPGSSFNNSTTLNVTIGCTLKGSISPSDENYNDRCNMDRSLWEFTKPKDFSIITDWELICEKEYLSYIANSALFIGWGIGAIVLGWISDRYGRKIVLFPSWIGIVLLAFVSGFVGNIGLFIFLRLLSGFCQGGQLTLFVMATELVGPKHRSLAGTAVWFGFTGALCLMGLQAYLVPKWKTLEIISSIPYIILLVSYKFVPESVRWLRIKNRIKEATEILDKVARVNKRVVVDNIRLSQIPTTEGGNGSFINLFVPSTVGIATLIQCFAWFVNGQVYYGISLASDQLGGNMYRDFILTSLVEIPGNVLVILLSNRFGRKPTVISNMAIGGLSCICVAFIPTYGVYNAIRVTLGMIGKLCITISFNAIYIWSAELYPTTIRSQGMGLMVVVSRIGAASAPWVAQFLRLVHDVLPFTVMGGLALISAGLCSKLTETLGKATAETLNQSDDDKKKADTDENGVEMKGMAEKGIGYNNDAV